MLTYDGIMTTLRAMNAPVRATAGGTTRKPPCLKSASE
jgi:hypothetical protein